MTMGMDMARREHSPPLPAPPDETVHLVRASFPAELITPFTARPLSPQSIPALSGKSLVSLHPFTPSPR